MKLKLLAMLLMVVATMLVSTNTLAVADDNGVGDAYQQCAAQAYLEMRLSGGDALELKEAYPLWPDALIEALFQLYRNDLNGIRGDLQNLKSQLERLQLTLDGIGTEDRRYARH